jgi:molybdopterin molybdotransferase
MTSDSSLDLASLVRPREGSDLIRVADFARAIRVAAQAVDETETLPLAASAGRVLAGAVHAPRPLPVFDNAAMDGYAVAVGADGTAFDVVGRTAAGDPEARPLQPGEAVRIFTGAPLPRGATAVLMQEHASRDGDRLVATRPVTAGENIRRAGEDAPLGSMLIPAGAVLDARHIALLGAAGVDRVEVKRKVRVAVVSTGSELKEPGLELHPGSIYDANRRMLLATLCGPRVEMTDAGILPDRADILSGFVAGAQGRFDVLVTSGGTSSGEEDHLADGIRQAGGTVAQARLALKPGRPALLAVIGDLRIAGLPGNPVAALVTALIFARPLIEATAGSSAAPPRRQAALADFDHRRDRGRLEFLPARITGHDVSGLPRLERLSRGGSARLTPLAAADGFAIIAEDTGSVRPGDRLDFWPFAGLL